MKGKIVLVPFPFTDLTSTELRPALVLHEGERDVVVAFISSKRGNRTPVDVLISERNSEFKKTGLKLSSTVRIDKIATISKSLVLGEIGEVGPKLKKEINEIIMRTLNL